MTAVSTYAYTRAHTSTYVSDKLRNFLKLLVNHYGLNPEGVVDAWSDWVDRAARTWLETGDLEAIKIEFFRPGSDYASALWEFPIHYDGNGGDDMWVDRAFFQNAIAKAAAPPKDSSYRIALVTKPGRPDVPGVGPITMRSTAGLVARDVGTVIATPDVMASARYYR